MSSIPTKIKIGHLTYDVIFVKDPTSDDDHPLYGQHRPTDQKIVLSSDLKNKPERCKEILIHECMHALMDLYHQGPITEETVVDSLAIGTTVLLADNKKLREYLCSN